MSLEIERKFLIEDETVDFLKKNYQHEILGIAQWYTDDALKDFESKRIRLIVYPDGSEKWITGTKKSIGGSLVFREEIEKELEGDHSALSLEGFPFVLKIRYLFNTYPGVELVIDKFPANPFAVFDTPYLMEIEIKDESKNHPDIFDKVCTYFKVSPSEDVSERPEYTNHAIARKTIDRKKDGRSQKDVRDFLSKLLTMEEKYGE
ncbi:MAG TPA: hypothetical protein PK466_01145 [Thermotogota bacterium]|nr:hypothetical protein [Thermotogota bacterium]HPJ87655.1 hypothetical protein [Thermotogota bacterium]HPR94907.1 hypothetical protein [Thermotogota bacterium]